MRADMTLIEMVSTELRDMLGDDFDAETFWDSLDGETDALDLMDHLIAEDSEARAMADAIKVQRNALKRREKRKRARSAAIRSTMRRVLDVTGEQKVERPGATISRRSGSLSVQITDESAIPSQLTKTTIAPDKTEIGSQLKAGVDVPGAELVCGPNGVTVRVA